jgi:hypothetical protein
MKNIFQFQLLSSLATVSTTERLLIRAPRRGPQQIKLSVFLLLDISVSTRQPSLYKWKQRQLLHRNIQTNPPPPPVEHVNKMISCFHNETHLHTNAGKALSQILLPSKMKATTFKTLNKRVRTCNKASKPGMAPGTWSISYMHVQVIQSRSGN